MKNELWQAWAAIKRLYDSVLGIKDGTDFESTTEGVKRDISFRGHTAWILMFSIIIASIGLNVNSIAVIIGAMLISPLMGPIVGIGFALGTHNSYMMLRSFKNLAIAVTISIITSTLYFVLTPLNIEQTEILARTRPTILDVLVALFGGFAGIVAGSRKEKSNVIPGVAIATALMPPLCTAGYGLATLKFNYFFGAFYLFFINSTFISLSTFLVVRYLRFPVAEILNRRKFKRYRMIIITVVIVTIIPSAVIFYGVVQETRFTVSAENFIKDNVGLDRSPLISQKIQYSDTLSYIDLYFIGEPVPEETQKQLNELLKHYGLASESRFAPTKKTVLRIHQESDEGFDIEKRMSDYSNEMTIGILEELYSKNEEVIKDRDKKIQLLENQLLSYKRKDTLQYEQLYKEIKFHFKEVERFSYAGSIEVSSANDSIVYDTVPMFLINFDDKYSQWQRKRLQPEIEQWLRVRLNNEKIKTVDYK